MDQANMLTTTTLTSATGRKLFENIDKDWHATTAKLTSSASRKLFENIDKDWQRDEVGTFEQPRTIKYRLHTKFMVGIAALLMLLMCSTILIVENQMRRSILDEFFKRGASVTRSIAAVNTPFVTTYNYINIEQSLEYFVKENNLLYATVLFFDGDVAAFRGPQVYKDQVLSGVMHDRALQTNDTLIQYGKQGHNAFSEIAVPIKMEGEKWGTVRVGFPLDHIQVAITKTRNMLIGVGGAALLLGCLAAFMIARRITRPIDKLVTNVEAISDGDFENTIKINTQDEIGFLGNRFQTMQSTIKQQLHLLTKANDQLLDSNQKLQDEIRDRLQAENALIKRDTILQAVALVVEQLLKEPHWEHHISAALASLGNAIDARRLFIVRGNYTGDQKIDGQAIFEWNTEAYDAPVPDPQSMLAGASPTQGTGNHQKGLNFTQQLVMRKGMANTGAVPIVVDDREWGFLGYELPRSETRLRAASVDAVKTVAGNLGAAIQRRQSMDRLKAANRAKDDFLANMSHELRTPLNHVIGFTELIVDGICGDVNDQQQEYLNFSLQSSRHLLELINEILDLSKVESGKMELELSSVNVELLLTNCLSLIKEKALNHNIALQSQIEVESQVVADERKLRQILFNLLANAVKFTPDGGEVTIEAQIIDCAVSIGRRETDPHHAVIMEPPGGSAGTTENVSPCLKIAVMDSGIGIQKGHLNRIFDRFDQVESSASRKFQGSGLGLSLAKSFVELHGGKIWAESDGQGKGSTFAFIIPTRLEEAVTIHPPTAADTEPLQKGGIS